MHYVLKFESPFLIPRKLEWGASASDDILIDDIRELTVRGLRASYALTLSEFKASFRFPGPPEIPSIPEAPVSDPIEDLPSPSQEPKWEHYAPRIGLLDRLMLTADKARREAVLAFNAARRDWETRRDGIVARNKERVARFERESEQWWAEKIKFDVALRAEQTRYEIAKQKFFEELNRDCVKLQRILDRRSNREADAICDYHELVAVQSPYPAFFPRDVDCSYDSDTRTLLIEHALPDVSNVRIIDPGSLHSKKIKLVPMSVRRDAFTLLHTSVAVRSVYEAARSDSIGAIDWIGFNGHVTFRDPVDGQLSTLNVLSCFVSKSEAVSIDLQHVDATACVRSWKSRMFPNVDSYVAVQPILRFDKADGRIVESREILEGLATDSNLAAMPWEDFEHLIRELFQREFGSSGAEVKVTRASRDWGVDAIVFDPDPIRGGKFVIQAKRYTRLVDVGAVRDLYGTLVNEGANRGFLVTTSGFGPESIHFAKDKPITLIDGAALLGLLTKHNYHFRIDLEEARRLQKEA